MGNNQSIEGGDCCNMRDIERRTKDTFVTDDTVIMDIKNHIQNVCQLAPGSPSCRAATKHLEYMEESVGTGMRCSASDIDDDDVVLDVFASTCPYVETTEKADKVHRSGLCNPDKAINVFKYVKDMVNEIEAKEGPLAEKQISSNTIINKAASVTDCDTPACVLTSVAKKYNVDTGCDRSASPKPRGPKNSTEWLSNDHTDKILADLEKEFGEFYWFQTTMMNFDEDHLKRFLRVSDDKNLRYSEKIILDEVDNGKSCFGCILNVDKTTNCKDGGKCGSHWVCVFVDTRKLPDSPWTIEYFDSVGDPPPLEICQWQERLRKVFEKYRKEQGHTGGVVCDVNQISHQKQNNECGVYCSYFVRARVEGIPFSRFKNRKLPDAVMVQYRRYLFSRD